MSTEQPRSRNRKKKVVVVVAGVAVLGTAGVAYAYWTADGTGTGTSTTGTNVAITVNQTTGASNLKPGSGAQPLAGNFTNPAGNGRVRIGTVTATVDSVAQANGATGSCGTSDYEILNPVATVNAEIAEGSGVGAWSGPSIQFNNKAAVNQDGCKGATVTVKYATTTS